MASNGINASSDRVGLSFVEEAIQGTTPTNPKFTPFRYTGSTDLKTEPKTEMSKEITADRQVKDLLVNDEDTSGSVAIEFSEDSYEGLIEGAMFNNWQKNIVRNDKDDLVNPFTSITALSSTTGTIDLDATVTVAPFKVDDILYIDGVDASINGAIVQVTVVPAVAPFDTEFLVLNNFGILDYTCTDSSKVYQVGLEFQDVISATVAPNTLTSVTSDFTAIPSLRVGQWIKIGSTSNFALDGFDTLANNDFVKIGKIETNTLTLDKVPSGWVADANSGSKKIAIFFNSYIDNGVVEKSYTLERTFKDHTPIDYQSFLGMMVNQWSIDNSTKEICTGSFDFIGRGNRTATVRATGATDLEESDTSVFNTVNNINYLELDDIDISAGSNSSGKNLVLKMSFDIKNNLREQKAIGSLSSQGVGVGMCEVTGSLQTYFQDNTILELLNNNTDTSLRLRYSINNRYMIFDFPTIKISSGAPEVSGVNTDVEATYGWQALKDDKYGITMSISSVTTY